MIKLLGVDMDGTVLNSEVKVAPKTKEALQKAIEKGVMVLPSTGRSLSIVPQEILDIPGIEYAITSNGAAIQNIKTGDAIYSQYIPEEMLRQILDIIKDYDTLCEYYILGTDYITEKDAERITEFVPQRYWDLFKEDMNVIPESELKYIMDNVPVEKINVRTKLEDSKDYKEIYERLKGIEDLEVLSQPEGNLEMTYIDANKGEALAAFANLHGIDCSEVMAIGDSDNDISMLKFADTGVAMGQAEDHVKQSANFVTKTNDEDGVAVAIEEFILSRDQEGSEMPDEMKERIVSKVGGSGVKPIPTVYCYSRCTTCRKALNWLKSKGVVFRLVEITDEPPTEEDFLKFFEETPRKPRQFFNTSGKIYREMQLKDKVGNMTKEEIAHLLSTDGMLIKRPLLVLPDLVLTGFKPEEWEEALKIS